MCPFKNKRQEFIDTQKNVSETEFLSSVDADTMCAPYITMIREIIAEMCKVPPEKIHIDTDTALLYRIGPWYLEPWDDIGVIMAFEEMLSIDIDGEYQEHFPKFTGKFGDYARAIDHYMVRITQIEGTESDVTL